LSKLILVTGAAGLLGVQHVQALITAGHRVIASDIDRKILNSSFKALKSDRLSIELLDVTDENQIKSISEKYNFDVLINNAAIDAKVSNESMSPAGRLENFRVDNFNLEIEVGLTGAILCSKHIGAKMNSLRGGKIINIASDLSVISPNQQLYEVEGIENRLQPKKPVSYSVIKHGMIGLTKYLSTYWPEKVTCNALSPGGVYTDQNEKFLKKIVDLIPKHRMANPSEYHGAIQFLASDASDYLNGHNLVMDGGRSIW
jgi:NAD(P)-dependent dehydrogenase (short-subunit alcohol dehydrogenase family)